MATQELNICSPPIVLSTEHLIKALSAMAMFDITPSKWRGQSLRDEPNLHEWLSAEISLPPDVSDDEKVRAIEGLIGALLTLAVKCKLFELDYDDAGNIILKWPQHAREARTQKELGLWMAESGLRWLDGDRLQGPQSSEYINIVASAVREKRSLRFLDPEVPSRPSARKNDRRSSEAGDQNGPSSPPFTSPTRSTYSTRRRPTADTGRDRHPESHDLMTGLGLGDAFTQSPTQVFDRFLDDADLSRFTPRPSPHPPNKPQKPTSSSRHNAPTVSVNQTNALLKEIEHLGAQLFTSGPISGSDRTRAAMLAKYDKLKAQLRAEAAYRTESKRYNKDVAPLGYVHAGRGSEKQEGRAIVNVAEDCSRYGEDEYEDMDEYDDEEDEEDDNGNDHDNGVDDEDKIGQDGYWE